jgi:hypothetical protein
MGSQSANLFGSRRLFALFVFYWQQPALVPISKTQPNIQRSERSGLKVVLDGRKEWCPARGLPGTR